MKRNFAGFAGLLTVFVIDLQAAPPAEACGVKLTIKTSAPRKAVARTSRPSQVLLLGAPPRRLERDLAAAGHQVEVVSDPAAAKRPTYGVVIADSEQQASAARSKFGGDTVVVVRSGDVGADLSSVEDSVARRPVSSDRGRAVVAVGGAGAARQPIAVGPTQPEKKMVAVKEPTEAPVADPPAPVTPAVRPTPPPVTPPRPVAEKPKDVVTEPKPRTEDPPVVADKPAPKSDPAPKTVPAPKAVASASELHDEIYFSLGSANLRANRRLARDIQWLTENSSVKVVVEGHADPTGTPEGNMALAQTRAESVRDFLVAEGIDASRIEVISYGDTRLKYGRADSRNRRVAIEAKK